MKYNSYDEKPFMLPKVRIKDTIKEKSTFVDHNRRSYQEISLDDLDLSWLDKSRNKEKKMNQPRGRASRYLYVLTQTKRFDPDIILYILFLDSLRNFLFDFHYHFF